MGLSIEVFYSIYGNMILQWCKYWSILQYLW